MSLPEHLQTALDRMENAERAIGVARAEPASLESMHAWLSGLTDYVFALAELHELDREHIDGSLHRVAERVGLERLHSERHRPAVSSRR